MPNSQSQAGLDFENEMAVGVYERTDGNLIPFRPGFSGNYSVPVGDLVIDDGSKVHIFEFKRTSQDRKSVYFDPDGIGESNPSDDISELISFAEQYPRTVCAYVGVRFTNRQLALAKLWLGGPDHRSMLKAACETCPIDVRHTNAGNLSFHKPQTEAQANSDEVGWPSEQAGDNIDYILDTIGWSDE